MAYPNLAASGVGTGAPMINAEEIDIDAMLDNPDADFNISEREIPAAVLGAVGEIERLKRRKVAEDD